MSTICYNDCSRRIDSCQCRKRPSKVKNVITMYCGSNKTALCSQQALARALLALMEQTPYREISVSALCRRADVSRQTFYTLFESKENVLFFALGKDCRYSCPLPLSRGEALTALSRGFGRYVVEHAQLIGLLAENDIMPLLRQVLKSSLEACKEVTACVQPALRPFAPDYVAAVLASAAQTYVRESCSLTEAQLSGVICALLGGGWLL